MDKNFYKNFIIITVIAAGILSFLGNEYYKRESSFIMKTAIEDSEAKLLRLKLKKRIKNRDYSNDYSVSGMLKEIDTVSADDTDESFKEADTDLNSL